MAVAPIQRANASDIEAAMTGRGTKRKLPESGNAVCYLYARPISPEEEWNRDHFPPRQIFARALRKQYNPELIWLYLHRQS